MVLRRSGGASGCAAISRVRSVVLYRRSGSARRVGSSPASALTVATCRGGQGGLAPPPRLVRQGKAAGCPAFPPDLPPVRMPPQVVGGGHAVEARLRVQQQHQLGADHVDVGRVLLADEPLASHDLLRREGWAIGGRRARHGEPPVSAPPRGATEAPTLPAPRPTPQAIAKRSTKPGLEASWPQPLAGSSCPPGYSVPFTGSGSPPGHFSPGHRWAKPIALCSSRPAMGAGCDSSRSAWRRMVPPRS